MKSERQLRLAMRRRRFAKRWLPAALLRHRRRKQAEALAAKRPQPSRRERHLARLAEREHFQAMKPTFED